MINQARALQRPFHRGARYVLRAGFTLLAGIACSATALADSPPDNTPPEGFVALFNGHDLSGWKGLVGNPLMRAKMSAAELAAAQAKADEKMREHWSVQEGALVYDGRGESLCTAEDYANFELLLDWKIGPAGDSGIYLRGSPQVQIWDADHEPYFGLGANLGSGSLWNNEKNPRQALVRADRPVGQWNTFWIRMVGERVSVKLNDQLVTDNVVMENYWDRGQPIFSTGQIELQHHGNKLWFKNLYLKRLPD